MITFLLYILVIKPSQIGGEKPTNRAKKTTVMVAFFAGFIVTSIGIEVYREFNPILPSRVGNGPYGVNLQQINDYSTMLEGELVTFTSNAWNILYNVSSDVLRFQVKDETHYIEFFIIYNNFSNTNGGIPPAEIVPGTLCAIQAVSRIDSSGYLVGMQLQPLHPNRVYILSIIGLVLIVALVLIYYKIDLKRLFLVTKKKNGGFEK